MSQEIGDDVLFIEVFKRRLIDNEKLLYYKEYKINLEFWTVYKNCRNKETFKIFS